MKPFKKNKKKLLQDQGEDRNKKWTKKKLLQIFCNAMNV